ncbi:hypothetical protein GUJ93_ZPchr0005g14823 [Zizania palustris]|uniref:Uncharacterized protein n=1 Tax=Zizania palustris TaxID=103762 RepID=A0A8J5W217_ZIZPA|nr:hypothetical protein GUJ93_ZPchr0005g14823 [Zizania palustris]
MDQKNHADVRSYRHLCCTHCFHQNQSQHEVGPTRALLASCHEHCSRINVGPLACMQKPWLRPACLLLAMRAAHAAWPLEAIAFGCRL